MTSTDQPPAAAQSTKSASKTVMMTLRSPQLWTLIGLIFIIACAAQAIGPLSIPLGVATATLLPMIWGIIAGAGISGQRWRPMPPALQDAATSIMSVAVLVLCARLSFSIGPNVALLRDAGPALLLQEVGHLFGTIFLALPLAVLLKMGPATIGATFSIDREGSFAMVSERYGSDSPQYRGVLSMYIFGTIFGAVIVSIVASLAVGLGLFDPLALAMGSGVGSGSMMAAAAGVVANGHPELTEQIMAVAGTSNLITNFLGLYVGVWIALPFADWFYRFLTRNQKDKAPAAAQKSSPAVAVPSGPTTSVGMWSSLAIISVGGIAVAVVASRSFHWQMIAAYAILSLLTAGGIYLARFSKGKIPGIITVMTVGALISSPISPIAAQVVEMVSSIDFLTVITVMLTIAGLSIGKDLPMLRSIGWKIIPVGTVAIVSSFLLSAVVAEFALGLWG